jgi:tetratricopeptide (TPR) repeat protein
VEIRLIQGLVGMVVLGALVVFTVFPQVKPDWIQIGSGRGKARPAVLRSAAFFEEDEAELAVERGVAHFMNEDWDKAAAAFSEALRRQPKDLEALYLRGVVRGELKQYDLALEDLNAVLRLEPDNVEALVARSETYSDLKQEALAMADIEEAIRLAPDDVEARIIRGKIREDACDYKAALKDYNEALRLSPDDPWALNNLAWVLAAAPDAKLRNGPKALRAAMRAVELDEEKDWISLDTLAAACAENGQFPAAERCQLDALKLAPSDEHEELQARLALYRAQQPYRLPAAPTAP